MPFIYELGDVSKMRTFNLITNWLKGIYLRYWMLQNAQTKSKTQVDQIVNYLGNLPGIYWIDIETNPSPGCGWQDANTNCGFLHNLVSDFQAKGVKVAIYASDHMWTTIFGAPENCNQFSNLQLWYPDYDGQKSFADFQSFGGWKSPTIKQYSGTGSACGASVDLNWYPNWAIRIYEFSWVIVFFGGLKICHQSAFWGAGGGGEGRGLVFSNSQLFFEISKIFRGWWGPSFL